MQQKQRLSKSLLYSLLFFSLAGCTQYHKAFRIIDGDTFVIEDNRRVRMIGIDTPERNEFYFDEAKVRLIELIDGQRLRLEKQVSETDRFDRLLRDVYVNSRFINKIMVEEGYARARAYPPDVKYKDVLKAAEKRAKEAKIGIWNPQSK